MTPRINVISPPLVAETDLRYCRIRFIFELEEFSGRKIEHPRNQIAWEQFQLRIEVTHSAVVVTSRLLNNIFQVR